MRAEWTYLLRPWPITLYRSGGAQVAFFIGVSRNAFLLQAAEFCDTLCDAGLFSVTRWALAFFCSFFAAAAKVISALVRGTKPAAFAGRATCVDMRVA